MLYLRAKLQISEPIKTALTASKIRYICDCDCDNCEYVLQMIHSNRCGQLETLELDIEFWHDKLPMVIPQLKNMPVLKNLTLQYPDLRIANMEILHDNLPSIQTLYLNDLSIADSTMPANITPATSLTNVKFDMDDSYRITDLYCKWYLYMSQKYVNVKEWRYLDRNQMYLDIRAEQFYNDGFLQLVQLVAQTQSYLSLCHIPAIIDVVQHLDNVGVRIENFDSRKCPEYSNLGSFRYFQNLKSLTTLTLENQRDDLDSKAFNLTGCLNASLVH